MIPRIPSYTIVGFTYEAGIHCVACAERRFGPAVYEHPDDGGARDREGNPVHPVFAGDEHGPAGEYCDDCGAEIWAPSDSGS